MFDRRYVVTGSLELLSPMHIGSGEIETIAGVGGKVGSNTETPGVARVICDHEGRPWLPPTTLKGMLRRIAENVLLDDEVKDLFGSIKSTDSASGAMGSILVTGASLDGEPPDVTGYPYVKSAGNKLAPGAFVAARASIDALAGVADDHKLFYQETVAPGAKFPLRLTLMARDDRPGRLDALLSILAELAADNGVTCGRGKADGAGALRLQANSLVVTEKCVDAKGKLVEGKPARPPLSQRRRQVAEGGKAPLCWRGIFVCDGPFLSVDSSHDPGTERSGEADRSVPQLVYQRGAKGQPIELGSQIAGVLRARARWIAGLEALEQGRDPTSVDPSAVGNEQARIVRRYSDLAQLKLTPVERLFGVNGFAGLLAIDRLRILDSKPFEITSVKLDHFSGAPIDKALFATRAVIGARLELALRLQRRRKLDERAEDRKLFESLVGDMTANGLSLGHGWAKGFGWFELKEGAWDE